MSSVGENIKRIRKEKGVTQQEMAKLLGISRSYLANLEAGRKNVGENIIKKMSESSGLSMLYLTTGQKTMADLTDDEFKEAAKSMSDSFHENLEYSRKYIKNQFESLLSSELDFTETMYLVNALNLLLNSDKEDVMTFGALLGSIRQTEKEYIEYLKEDGSYKEEEMKEFIRDTTEFFQEYLEKRVGIKK